jgi:hypothetical protein
MEMTQTEWERETANEKERCRDFPMLDIKTKEILYSIKTTASLNSSVFLTRR